MVSIKRIAVLLVIVFIGLYLFFNVLPIVIVSPAPLYHIYNADEQNHNITVEIFDENNVSVLKKHYMICPEESVDIEREINWHLPFTSSFVTWNDRTYRFNFTVDGNVSKEYIGGANQYECISVSLYTTDYSSSEIIPIKIGLSSF